MRAPDPRDGEGEDLFQTEHGASDEAARALAERLQEEGEDGPVTVDVREADAYETLRVAGAVHLPAEDLEEAEERLPEGDLCYVYGQDHASEAASQVTLLLAQEGFPVQEVQGGFAALREAGAPLAGSEA